MAKIFLAGIFHETHSFTDDRTGLSDFMIHRGQDLLDRIGDGSQVDGFLTTAARKGWQVVPSANYLCGASGMVEHAVFDPASLPYRRPFLAFLRREAASGREIFLVTRARPEVAPLRVTRRVWRPIARAIAFVMRQFWVRVLGARQRRCEPSR